MIISDLRMNKENILYDVECNTYEEIKSKDGKIEKCGYDKFKFVTNDNTINFNIANEKNLKLITEKLDRNFYALATITAYDVNKKNYKKQFFLQISFFSNFQRLGKIPIIIDDDIKERIEKRYVRRGKELNQVLEDNFKLVNGRGNCFAYTNGSGYNVNKIDEVKEIDESNDIVENNDEKFEKKVKNKEYMNIYGKDFDFQLVIENQNEIDSKLKVKKLISKRRKRPTMRIAEGTLEFSNHKMMLSKKVKEILSDTKGYLEIWNQYSEQEGNLLLENARKVGLISVERNNMSKDKDGIYLPYIKLSDESKEIIGNNSFLLFSDEKPIYLENEKITWDEYKEKELENSIRNKGEQVKVKRIENGGFILEEIDGALPSGEYISLSIIGDKQQIYRRENARNRIKNGEAANPNLGLILEGKLSEELISAKERERKKPLSDFVRNKIFKNDPTPKQREAIEIALNTPDIAIIQGPPGTGKTTVITAIIERLNELCDKNEKVSGQVLITSFQHDAVRNVIERLRVNSLPTIKFGKQSSDEEDLTNDKLIEEWCENYIEILNEKNPELFESEQMNILNRLHNIYLVYPNDTNAMNFLNFAKTITNDIDIIEKIERLIEIRKREENHDNLKILNLIRRLRTTKEGFLDDGSENADILLQELESIGLNTNIDENAKIVDILDKASYYFDKEPDEELLSDLSFIKSYLLKKCIPKPIYKIDSIDSEVVEIYNELNLNTREHEDRKAAILGDLLRELRINRYEVEKSLEHYLFVYSATTQQSEGKEIKNAKNVNKNAHPEYDTVVVDEAARVNPADLMIPLAQAKNRIILVGDHRQLPHIYNEEVFENIKSNGEDFDINNIKKSMFEYLFEKAKELEKIDNIQRTVTLDAQYRMHPVLGNFASDEFYKIHNEEEAFKSPRQAYEFEQFISKKQFPIEWYNLPDKYGSERKVGTSRVRDCEAEFIAEKIYKSINSNEGKNLSYGVISFYSEQVKLIKKILKNKLGTDSEKVRVGSVDAFQGMEFDVIFLSIVRSNRNKPTVRISRDEKPKKIDFEKLEVDKNKFNEKDEYKEWELYRDKVGLQNYGFLVSENRLCVALTRQKKLLIVVGNADMFSGKEWGRLAEICVPGIKHLYELCDREGVIYSGKSEGI